LTRATARRGTEGRSPEEHREELRRRSNSTLEQAWIAHLERHGYRLPDRAQVYLESCHTRADFGYSQSQALVYIDGPHHEHDTQRQVDARITTTLEEAGYTVIRFPQDPSQWPTVFANYPDVFGTGAR
jgi:Uncharacterized protein conserved in bacteria